MRRKKLGQTVCIMDPFEVAGDGAEIFRRSFNPIEAVFDPLNETPVEDAGLIADAIVASEDQKLDQWDESARRLIEGLILYWEPIVAARSFHT